MPTLDATVSGASANSYQVRADAAALLDNLTGFEGFAAATADQQDRALISAAQHLDRLIDWDLSRIGLQPASTSQRMLFPRIGTYDQHGTVLASTSIPPWLLELHAVQAGYEVITTRVAEPARGIRRVKAGSLEVEQDPVATSVQRVIADLVWKLAGPWRRGDAFMTAAIARA